MKLTDNFHLREFTKSQIALRRRIPNNPSPEALKRIRNLCRYLLQPLREKVDGPINISSGFRSRDLNLVVGGIDRSQHMFGMAADIETPKMSNVELAQLIRDEFDFDQLILEFHTPGDPWSGWVHVSYKNKRQNRNEILTATHTDGKVVYSKGINA